MDEQRRTQEAPARSRQRQTERQRTVVEAYLADEQAGQLASLLKQVTGSYHLSKTPLLPPSFCLPLLD